jgi:SAM-dependent methyltransferase
MTMKNVLTKKRRLFQILQCPRCRGGLQFNDCDYFDDLPIRGSIDCGRCGRVGFVENFRPFFNAQPPLAGRRSALPPLSGAVVVEGVPLETLRAVPDRSWLRQEDGYFAQDAGAALTLRTQAVGVEFRFLMHPWSGHVEVKADGELRLAIDLFESTGSRISNHPLFLGEGTHIIEIICKGVRHSDAQGTQVWLQGIDALSLRSGPTNSLTVPAFNAGNAYPRSFEILLAGLPADASVLDCGCGDRQHPDRRVIGFEYGSFKGPDAFGDGHRLPFKDSSFDFVLSQAVIEHLYDPRTACDEIHRILKPGGLLYVESAFMQPLHAVPFHFFNTTAWGLAELLKLFELLETRHEGTLHQTLSWIYGLTALRDKGYGTQLDAVLDGVRQLDQHITRDELKSFSSFIAMTARKR